MTDSSNTIIQSQNKFEPMKLGVFSISLNVKDLTVSKAFYENLGFTVFGGDLKMNYLIMKNESTIIGLFQGMFEKNILTFNPDGMKMLKNLIHLSMCVTFEKSQKYEY